MEQTTTKLSVMNVFKFAGAIIAFLIGSGFASGQEVLQFFTNYGLKGILGVFVAMTLFVVLGAVLMRYGFNHRNELASNGIRHYCGKIFGTFMEWYTPFFCFLIGVIMVSGAGATVNEYFGWPNLVGTVGMTVIVFITTLFVQSSHRYHQLPGTADHPLHDCDRWDLTVEKPWWPRYCRRCFKKQQGDYLRCRQSEFFLGTLSFLIRRQ